MVIPRMQLDTEDGELGDEPDPGDESSEQLSRQDSLEERSVLSDVSADVMPPPPGEENMGQQ